MIANLAAQRAAHKAGEFLPLLGTDHIEFYVGNAKQAAHYYQSAFGFQPLAYAGPETGVKDKVSYVLRQNKIKLVFTTALRGASPIAEHFTCHGDGVRIIALGVDDAAVAYRETVSRGANPYVQPSVLKDKYGEAVVSGIHTYGDTVHLFVERKNYDGFFLPGFAKWDPHYQAGGTGLMHIDHCVANVGWNRMQHWVKFYENIMGFKNILSFDDKDISTEYSALMSKVMSNGNGYVKFPINEPAKGKKKSQVEEFLEFYRGEGVQHIAMATGNIIQTVTALRDRGVEFLKVPGSYYKNLLKRVGSIDEDISPLEKLGILVDRDEEGYLLQIFTRPVQDRPTMFFEIIQRKGATSFGKGNFKALFQAIEREQEARGNL
jgi:4-hydroxyphenylpyruvate dioxygenase